jgi:Protein of unknown function (DUF2939).
MGAVFVNEINKIRAVLVKVCVSIGAIIIFGALIAFVFYYVTGLPQYSLWQIKEAVKTHDVERFNKYVDIDLIAESLIASQLKVSIEVSEKTERVNVENMFALSVKFGVINMKFPDFMSNLKKSLKMLITEQIETMPLSEESKSAAKIQNNKSVAVYDIAQEIVKKEKLNFQTITNAKNVDLRREGKISIVKVRLNDVDEVSFRLRQSPDRIWKVVSIGVQSEEDKKKKEYIICSQNIDNLNDAVKKWATDKNENEYSLVRAGELWTYLPKVPACPSGGQYIFRTVKDPVRCDLHNAAELKQDELRFQEELRICTKNIVRLTEAIQQWAYSQGKSNTDTVQMSELTQYLKPVPRCPSGGTYTLNCVGDTPECPVHGKVDEVENANRNFIKEREEKVRADRLSSDLAQAKKSYEQGNEKDAINYYKDAKELDETLPGSIYHYLGVLYADARIYKDALLAYEKAYKLANTDYAVCYQIGHINNLLGRYEAAIDFLKKALTGKSNKNIIDEIASCYLALKRHEDVIKIYKNAIKAFPELFYEKLGALYYSLARYDEAISVFKEGLPKIYQAAVPSFHNHLGNCYYMKKEYREAQGQYIDALFLDQNNPEYNFNLGRNQLANDDPVLAIHHLELAERNGMKDAQLYHFLGKAYKGNKELEKAKKALEDAIKLCKDPGLLEEIKKELDSLKINEI